MTPRGLVALIALFGSGCGAGAFACQDSMQCTLDGAIGTCQPDGWCSFPDEDCATGERYGDHAGDGLAGRCVPEGGSTGEGGSSSPSSLTSLDSTVGESTQTTAGTSITSTSDSTTSTSTTTTTTTDTLDTSAEDPLTCGDGVVQADEECDLGNENSDAGACTSQCRDAFCGDGLVHADAELCDGKAFGGLTCADYGFPFGELTCSLDCQLVDLDGCDCGMGGCDPFGPCTGAGDCNPGDTCTSFLSDVGTCGSPCNLVCEDGSYCTITFSTCALPCEGDGDCPQGMACADLPSDDQRVCMW